MADIFGWNFDIVGIFGNMGTAIMYLILLAALIITVLFFINLSKYKHKFRIKILTGGKVIEVDDKAKTKKTKEGIIYWKLLKRKDRVPVPPADAINVTNKGKLSVTAYYTETGQYVYAKNAQNIDDAIEDPLTTTDREFYLNEVKKAEAEKGKKLSEWVMQMAPFLALIIILVMALSFWGTITQPYTQATNNLADTTAKMEEISENQAQTMRMINEIVLQKQEIKSFNMSTELIGK